MKYSVVAIAGAIEELSLAKNILAAAQKIDIGTLEIEVCPIQDLPLLNVDLFTDAFPKAIERLRKRVGQCDALLFASPEFFGKVSPAMKNAYDWLSYSPDLEHPSPVRNLPAALISVGAGEDGQNVQKHFLQMAQFCRLRVMAKPNLHFSTKSKNLYNEKLELTETANEELYKFLEYFSDFIGKKRKNQ